MIFPNLPVAKLIEIKSYEDLLSGWSLSCNMSNYEEIKTALSLRESRYGSDGAIPFYLNPVYREISPDRRFVFIKVGISDDVVFCFFKEIKMFSNRFLRLIWLPISLSGNELNEAKVLKVLVDNKLIKQIYYIDQEKKLIGLFKFKKAGEADYDYYSLVDERWGHIDSNKWRRHNRINRFIEHTDFGLVKSEEVGKLRDLYDWWKMGKKDHGHGVTSGRGVENALKLLERGSFEESALPYRIFYKGIPLIFCIFYYTPNRKVVRCEQEFSLAMSSYPDNLVDNLNEEERQIFESLIDYSSKYLLYGFIQDFKQRGIERYYNAGGRTDSLLVHKKIFDDRCITYYKALI